MSVSAYFANYIYLKISKSSALLDYIKLVLINLYNNNKIIYYKQLNASKIELIKLTTDIISPLFFTVVIKSYFSLKAPIK